MQAATVNFIFLSLSSSPKNFMTAVMVLVSDDMKLGFVNLSYSYFVTEVVHTKTQPGCTQGFHTSIIIISVRNLPDILKNTNNFHC